MFWLQMRVTTLKLTFSVFVFVLPTAKPCIVQNYTFPLVSDFISGSFVECGQTCTFQCDDSRYKLHGSSSVRCCYNRMFSPELPTCKRESKSYLFEQLPYCVNNNVLWYQIVLIYYQPNTI